MSLSRPFSRMVLPLLAAALAGCWWSSPTPQTGPPLPDAPSDLDALVRSRVEAGLPPGWSVAFCHADRHAAPKHVAVDLVVPGADGRGRAVRVDVFADPPGCDVAVDSDNHAYGVLYRVGDSGEPEEARDAPWLDAAWRAEAKGIAARAAVLVKSANPF